MTHQQDSPEYQASPEYPDWLDRMTDGVALWHEICDGLPLDVLDRQPAPGVWSIKQNTFHLADAFEATTLRSTAMLDETEPQLLRFDADEWAAERDYQGRPWGEAVASLDHELERLMKVIGDLTASELERTGRQHNIAVNILGLPTEVLRLADLVRFEAEHVEEHLVSVQAIVDEHGPREA